MFYLASFEHRVAQNPMYIQFIHHSSSFPIFLPISDTIFPRFPWLFLLKISIRKFAGEVDRFLRYYMYILPELHFSGYIQAADSGFLGDSGWFGDENPNPRLSQIGKIVEPLKQIYESLVGNVGTMLPFRYL